MRKKIFTPLLLVFFTLFISNSCGEDKNKSKLRLWYDTPALAWEQAVPLGNGRIGAMVFGNPLQEHFQLNESTLWSGYPKDFNNPKAKEGLPAIREAINQGQYNEASKIWKNYAQGPYTARYLPMADLRLNMSGAEHTNLYRDLNISEAVSTVTYMADGIKYTRTSFISYPDQVMVVRLEADKKKSLSLDLTLDSPLRYTVAADNNKHLVLKGKAPKYVAHRNYDPQQVVYADDEKGEGINFEVHVKVLNEGGDASSKDGKLVVDKADVVTIILSAATSFNGFDKSPTLEGKDPSAEALAYLNTAIGKPYKNLLEDHKKDYKELFDRVELQLGDPSNNRDSIPTNARLDQFADNDEDQGTVALYFQFGRYLTIASSRVGGRPSNLQGIWNRHVQPPWGSNYTVNINTEMNYWASEPTGLQECHQPLLSFINELAINGRKTAEVNYGMTKGWVAHHNSDLWAQTAPPGGYDADPGSSSVWSCWPMASVWFSQHLWEHYAYGGDKQYLKEKAYPLMKGAAEFALQWLQQDDKTNYLVTSPATSPENSFLYKDKSGKEVHGNMSKASTMDMALVWDLFTNCMQAAKVLGIDNEFSEDLKLAKSKLYPPHLGAKGQLQEWFEDFGESEPKHRHISHLVGLHPGKEILPRRTPETAAAAKQTLMLRGDGGTGWAMAWKVNFWARLEDGDRAYKMLKQGLRHVDVTNPLVRGGGTYTNMFDAHPPFQIDGNFGGVAGITEMLMQSHAGEIFILPALPDQWASGSIRGLRARGGFTLDIEWAEGKLTKVLVHSSLGGNCRIRSFTPVTSKDAELKIAEGENTNDFYFVGEMPNLIKGENENQLQLMELKASNLMDFSTEKGKTYSLLGK